MDNLLPISKLSPEARELLAGYGMSAKDKGVLIKSVAEDMTFDKVADFILEIKQEIPLEDGIREIDRILFTVRQAYIMGFAKAIEAYSDVIEMGLREEACDCQ